MRITYYLARRIAFTAFFSVALIALGAALSAVSALDKYSAIIKEIDCITAQSVSAESSETQCFFVRAHEGIIGIFNADGDLEYTIEVYVKTLPESDRSLLEKGIFAKSKADLLEILGDYDA